MNTWLLISLLPPILWALQNVLDKAITTNYIKNDFTFVVLISLLHLPFVGLFFLFNTTFPDPEIAFKMTLIGILWTAPYFLYIRALKTEDASLVAVLIQMTPVFTLLFAHFLLNESLTILQATGFIFLILAGITASLKKLEKRWQFSKSFILMAAATLLWAFADVNFKKIEPDFENFLNAFSFFFLGSSITGFFILFSQKIRRNLKETLRNLKPRIFTMFFIAQTSAVIGVMTFSYALTLGKASLTSVMLALQPLAALCFALILSKFIPEAKPESVSRLHAFLKIIAFCFVLVGLILISQ